VGTLRRGARFANRQNRGTGGEHAGAIASSASPNKIYPTAILFHAGIRFDSDVAVTIRVGAGRASARSGQGSDAPTIWFIGACWRRHKGVPTLRRAASAGSTRVGGLLQAGAGPLADDVGQAAASRMRAIDFARAIEGGATERSSDGSYGPGRRSAGEEPGPFVVMEAAVRGFMCGPTRRLPETRGS
jgi:hypothetical protein